MIDYAILKVIWWLFIGVLLVGFAVMDGQDMGVGTLLPFIGKTDTERRCMINAVAPHWDGNQVWFITGGGAMFAAWPMVYATAFSGFYWAMLVILIALILRPLAFDYRSKVPAQKWRSSWDWALFAGSVIPPVICGVAFGNLLQGVPFHLDETLRPIYTGNFFGLLNPFGLLCGVTGLLMMVCHGANYLVLRTDGDLQRRAASVSTLSALATLVFFVAGGVYTGADMAHFTKLGAAGVQLATRFIPTVECDAAQGYKDVLLKARPEDVRIIHSPVGMPGRALNTPLVQALAEGRRFPPRHCARCLKTCDPACVPYCITHALIEAVKGNVEEALDFYVRMCSLSVTAEGLANLGLLLANDGVDPNGGGRLLESDTVRVVKTIMLTCGMYDGSGEFAVRVGLPTKSGVGGGLLSLADGQMGIGIYGPALDIKGNSIAGEQMLRFLSSQLHLHMFDSSRFAVDPKTML